MRHKYTEELLIETKEPVEKNQNSFVALVLDVGSVNTEKRVIHHQADKEINTFEDFVENVLSEFSAEEQKLDNNKFLEVFMNNGVIEGDDFDEDSKRQWKTYCVEGVIVHLYNGFEWNELEKKMDILVAAFKENENSILEEYHEIKEEREDPYKYRGFSRSDFY